MNCADSATAAQAAEKYATRATADALTAEVARLAADLPGLRGMVDVHADESTLPADLRREVEKAGVAGRFQGAYYDGRISIVAANIPDVRAGRLALAEGILRHEGRHAGLTRVFGSDRAKQDFFMDAADAIDADVRTWLAANDMAVTPETRAEAAEEIVVEWAVDGTSHTLVDRLLARVMGFLRKVFPGLRPTRPEVREMMRRAVAAADAWMGGVPDKAGFVGPLGEMSPAFSRYQRDDGERLAPNGKPSNLNAEQYEQVRTKEFKDWFGDWESFARQDEEQKRGEAAMDTILFDKSGGVVAMNRPGLGDVIFLYGKPGRLNQKGRLVEGEGVSHLIEQRNLEGSDGEAVAREMPRVIAHGRVVAIQGEGTAGERVRVEHEGHTAVLSLYRGGARNTWLLTGWENEGGGAGVNPATAYASASSGISQPKGASDKIISLNAHIVNSSDVSAVLDENGEPLVVTHWTNQKVELLPFTEEQQAEYSALRQKRQDIWNEYDRETKEIYAVQNFHMNQALYEAYRRAIDKRQAALKEAGQLPEHVTRKTPVSIDVFDNEMLGNNTIGNAIDPALAVTSLVGHWFNSGGETKLSKANDQQINVYLSLKSPLIFNSVEHLGVDILGREEGSSSNALRKAAGRWVLAKKQKGYDGVMLEDEEFGGISYVVFSSNQIKSATGNNGQFDGTNPDIRFKRTPVTGEPEAAETTRERLNAWTDATVKSLATAKATEAGFFGRILRSPEWWKHPVLKRVYGIFRDRTDRAHELMHQAFDLPDGGSLFEMARDVLKDREARELLNEGVDHADVHEVPRERMEEWFRERGASDELVAFWGHLRDKYDALLDERLAPYREMVAKARDQYERQMVRRFAVAGIPRAAAGTFDSRLFNRDGKVSDALLPYLAQVKKQVKLAAAKGITIKGQLADVRLVAEDGTVTLLSLADAVNRMGQLRGFYAPRLREHGDFVVRGKRTREDGTEEFFRAHKQWRPAAERLRARMVKDGWDMAA